jgi:hypothetical protein
MVLLASVLEDAFGRDVDRVELLGGDERYKLAGCCPGARSAAAGRRPAAP